MVFTGQPLSPDNNGFIDGIDALSAFKSFTLLARPVYVDSVGVFKRWIREDVWYSDWGYQEPGKTHIRLTFNPYFDWQNPIMATVLSSEGAVSAVP